MFNDRLDENGWLHVPTTVCHPWQVPVKLRSLTCYVRQTGPAQGIVKGAVKAGLFIRADHLHELQAYYRFTTVKPGSGHGKNGNLVKRDFGEGLVNYLFPDASESEKREMLMAILGKNCKHCGKTTIHAKDILAAMNGLDTEDIPEFQQLHSVALNELDLHAARPNRQPRMGGMVYEPKSYTTPEELRRDLDSLCPTNAKIYRHPQLKRFQAFIVPAGHGLLILSTQRFV